MSDHLNPEAKRQLGDFIEEERKRDTKRSQKNFAVFVLANVGVLGAIYLHVRDEIQTVVRQTVDSEIGSLRKNAEEQAKSLNDEFASANRQLGALDAKMKAADGELRTLLELSKKANGELESRVTSAKDALAALHKRQNEVSEALANVQSQIRESGERAASLKKLEQEVDPAQVRKVVITLNQFTEAFARNPSANALTSLRTDVDAMKRGEFKYISCHEINVFSSTGKQVVSIGTKGFDVSLAASAPSSFYSQTPITGGGISLFDLEGKCHAFLCASSGGSVITTYCKDDHHPEFALYCDGHGSRASFSAGGTNFAGATIGMHPDATPFISLQRNDGKGLVEIGQDKKHNPMLAIFDGVSDNEALFMVGTDEGGSIKAYDAKSRGFKQLVH